MAKQVMIMAVVEDDWVEEDLHRTIQDVLVHKHDVCVVVEDITTTQENYDWKSANGVPTDEEEEETVSQPEYPSDLAAYREED
jgi:predicted GTPase